MKPLPEWMGQGIVLGVQGGEAVVRDIVNSSIKHDMKIAGIWMQDWCGERSQSIFGKSKGS